MSAGNWFQATADMWDVGKMDVSVDAWSEKKIQINKRMAVSMAKRQSFTSKRRPLGSAVLTKNLPCSP